MSELERLTHKPVPIKPLRPIIGLRWIGNRYQWWRLLATIGWIRGVASIPGVPDHRNMPVLEDGIL